ncbi:MAG: FMN-binding protein [bacterium]|nr:FMN-binding protein [bacterium]
MKKVTFKRFIVLAISVSMLMSILSGCGSKDNQDNNSTGNSDSASPSMEATMAPTTDESPNGGATDDANAGATNDANAPSSTGGANDTNGGTGVKGSDDANATGNAGDIAGAKQGNYTATAKGYSSDVTATVVITKDGKIDKVDVDASGETETIGQVAAPKIAADIVDKQTTNVDTVSGATYTSNAVITAVKDALTKAGVK